MEEVTKGERYREGKSGGRGRADVVRGSLVRRRCVSWADRLLMGKQGTGGGQIRAAVGKRVKEGIRTELQDISIALTFLKIASYSLWF